MTCEHCDRDIRHREVTLILAAGKTHKFCSDTCERRWMLAELDRRWRFLNRIHNISRGKARDVAHVALRTNLPP